MGKDFSNTTGHVIPTAHGRFDLSMAVGTFGNGHFGAVFFADVVILFHLAHFIPTTPIPQDSHTYSAIDLLHLD